jgi:hypothetical protein
VNSFDEQQLARIVNQYGTDLPSPELLTSELTRWQHYCKSESDEAKVSALSSISGTLDSCDADLFPNVNTLLKIYATLPVTTCECERSFSTLRRLNNYLRKCQSSDRLDSLALIHIHCDSDFNIDQIIDSFSRLHPRRMELSSLI